MWYSDLWQFMGANARGILFAILFLMFDVETVFLYPWATVFGQLSGEYGGAMLFSIGFFMLVLVFGLAYAWRKGALEWK